MSRSAKPEIVSPNAARGLGGSVQEIDSGAGSALETSTADVSSRRSGSWLAVWTKPRAEKVAARALEERAIPHWLPLVTERRRWSDRWKEVEVPLFASYLFAEVVLQDWASLLRIPGILTVVKRGREPAWIRESQMTELREALDRLSPAEHQPEVVHDFETGEKVRVIDGSLAGLVGVIREIRSGRRLLVGLEQIGQALSISIGAANVERLSER